LFFLIPSGLVGVGPARVFQEVSMVRIPLGIVGVCVALGAVAGALNAQTGPARPATTPATASAPASTRATELAVTESDNGKTLHLAVGRTAAISVAGNATTGYSWSLTKLEGTALEQAGSVEYTPDRARAGMVGTGGTSVARFRAVKSGQATITLGYARPWETGVAPAKSFTVTIVVDP
jgi:inhibitor of cysteine peptidase